MSLLSCLNPLFKGLQVVKPRKRVGRGFASGTGKTAGRGHKGQKSRAGARGLFMLEGGQTPIYRRLPKRGFNSYNQIFGHTVAEIDFMRLSNCIASGKLKSDVTKEDLLKAGFLPNGIKQKIKLLSNGTVKGLKSLEVDLASKGAILNAKNFGVDVKILKNKN